MALAEIRAKVVGADGTGGRLRDEAHELDAAGSTTNADVAIAAAVAEYGRVRPLDKAAKLSGAGSFDFAISGLTGFVDGGSTVSQVVYPYVSTTQRPVPLDAESWGLVRLDTGLVLRMFDAIPAAGEFVLVNYTLPYTLSAATSTIPATDDEALADLATSYACLALAGRFAQSASASLGADSVNHLSKADEYRQNAAKWRRAWESKMGIGKDADSARAIASGVTIELDGQFANAQGTPYFFHAQRGR